MSQKKYKRKSYIIDPEFQNRMIRRLCFLGIAIIASSLLFLTVVHHLYGDVQLIVTQPDPFKSATMFTSTPVEPSSLFNLLWPVMAICVGITLVFLFFFGIIMSHRMAGPIYRIRMILQEMTGGNLRGDVRLRKKDEFKHLANDLNDLKTSLRKTVQQMSEIVKSLALIEDHNRQTEMAQLSDILSRFKLD